MANSCVLDCSQAAKCSSVAIDGSDALKSTSSRSNGDGAEAAAGGLQDISEVAGVDEIEAIHSGEPMSNEEADALEPFELAALSGGAGNVSKRLIGGTH